MMTLKEKQQQKNGESLEGQPAHAWSPWCWFGGCGVSPPPQPWLRARQGVGLPRAFSGLPGASLGPFSAPVPLSAHLVCLMGCQA